MTVPPLPDADACEVSCVHPEVVARARAAQPDEEALGRAASLLKAVSDPTRLRLLTALGTGELCVCDLAAVAGTSESAVSHQLRLLRGQKPRRPAPGRPHRVLPPGGRARVGAAGERAGACGGGSLRPLALRLTSYFG